MSRKYYQKTEKYTLYKKKKKISLKYSVLPVFFYYVENLLIGKTFKFNTLEESKEYIKHLK
jgi:hypothetical protein